MLKNRIFTLIICSIFTVFALNAQIQINTHIEGQVTGSNAFLDASTAFSTESGASMINGLGVGMVFPTVDLVEFEFFVDFAADGIILPTVFHGMIVFNSATGTTKTDGNRSSVAVDVEPGFYFFYNPKGRAILTWQEFNSEEGIGNPLAAIRDGEWRPLGGGANNAWLVGGNMDTGNEARVFGNVCREPENAAPIIVYAAMPERDPDTGELTGRIINQGIMHIGVGVSSGITGTTTAEE